MKGHIHPLSIAVNDIVKIFSEMGFEVARGPEIETEENNFDLLNIPKHHPARDMHDTFWLKDRPGELPRTHISAHQVPYLRENKHRLKDGPLLMVSFGRVFRNEATDATHEAQFTYLEGLAIGEGINLSHLKGTLENFINSFFGDSALQRMRPGYFPFVEPGLEVDMEINNVWKEILGCGMVHPVVLKNAGIDSSKYSGFAFGVGVDRITMIRHKITDVRLFYQDDLRFINQF